MDRVGRHEHSFLVSGLPVDIVPFGGIETAERTIDWHDGTRMSTFDLLESYDFDPLPASAHRLGREIAGVLGTATSRLLGILDDDNLARLVADMPHTVEDQASTLRALRTGLRSVTEP